MCLSGLGERCEFMVRVRNFYKKWQPRAPGFWTSSSVETQCRRAKSDEMREEIKEEHTHGRADIYVSRKEIIMTAESLRDKTNVTKIRMIEEAGPAYIILEDGEGSVS